MPRHHVVIVGGGFAGLTAAQALRRAPVDITLIDKRNYHLFQPLLYQVATGALSPANIASPLRHVLKRQRNVEVRLATVESVDLDARLVRLATESIAYDTLVLATGSENAYFGHDAWGRHAPGLKTVQDATDIRARIFAAFEAAEYERDAARRRELLTFVIVGAGPTGLELAGALAEIARHTLAKEFRNMDPAEARVVLIEQSPRVLPTYPEALSAAAAGHLRRLGVQVRTSTSVVDIDAEGVTVRRRDADDVERIAAHTVLWAAGVKTSELAQHLHGSTPLDRDRQGRLVVGTDLSLPGYPEVFVIGDLANCTAESGTPLPALAPVATQQGSYVGKVIRHRLAGKPTSPFRYRDYGMMATIGRKLAVARIGGRDVSGYVAWLLWLLVHLMKIVHHENRVLVLVQWAWNYLTWNRSARLITKDPQ